MCLIKKNKGERMMRMVTDNDVCTIFLKGKVVELKANSNTNPLRVSPFSELCIKTYKPATIKDSNVLQYQLDKFNMVKFANRFNIGSTEIMAEMLECAEDEPMFRWHIVKQ